ncbi:hypothetical protein F4804DRAFT_318245 [Jackrogersella minutella]|nr:hypothetical protein F4804DRAFT_318245 [Jackrogersella minutella]
MLPCRNPGRHDRPLVPGAEPSDDKPPGDGEEAEVPSGPVYFFRPDSRETGYLSPWFPSAFRDPHDPSKVYANAQHYFLHHRALLFGDEVTAAKILETLSPHKAQEMARKIRNLDRTVWEEHRERVAYC